ncbi:MAG: ATP-dependent DNA helicase [Proteobacteria bacterium]|nr:ATP-dependent DNA helicase [Pseudomonadota bacterium]MBU1685915.1 ATP-dependent DNA helicase [Pseudomonadota bacterium]
MARYFVADGKLAQTLPGFRFRQGQQDMAEAVCRALVGSDFKPGFPGLLAAEAGTGTGKTLAYLIPAVISGLKMVISTGTLNLQDQILNKEIPFIQKHIDPRLTAICVKGRQNYLCLYRWQQLAATPQHRLFEDREGVAIIGEWLGGTEFGDRAELDWLADDARLWSLVSASTSQCLGSHCPEWQNCFITRLRKEAARAKILIVNHHLFFSDLALRRHGNGEVLPRYEAVIFDEAHHIESTATRYFGLSVSHYQILDLVRDLESMAQAELKERDSEKTMALARSLAAAADRWLMVVPSTPGRFPLEAVVEGQPAWWQHLDELEDRFEALSGHVETLILLSDLWQGMLRRCRELQAALREVCRGTDPAMIYWLERRSRTVIVSASPISVAEELRRHLYNQVLASVFTSATLTVAGDFHYFRERLGLPEIIETLSLATPFDYANRTLCHIPEKGFPEPNQPGYADVARQRIRDLIMLSGGRTLVLFTSQQAMQACYEGLCKEGLPFPLLIQGEAPRAALLDRFRREVDSVLLAVASFWEGVDVPGEALSCVIIDKLPFEVPSDPVVKARIERIREDGGNPFFDFQVPQAILSLRQGVGRLMRTSEDRGVLAILDVRLFSKGYGKNFRASLPPCPITRDLEDVAAFWRIKTV